MEELDFKLTEISEKIVETTPWSLSILEEAYDSKGIQYYRKPESEVVYKVGDDGNVHCVNCLENNDEYVNIRQQTARRSFLDCFNGTAGSGETRGDIIIYCPECEDHLVEDHQPIKIDDCGNVMGNFP